MLCSFVHETIVQVKAERGRFMRKYLFKQLQDLPNGINWASLLYMHGTIDLLSREPDKPTNEIQPDIFAKTLVEVVGNAHMVQMQLPALQQSLLSVKANDEAQPQQFINTTQNYFSHATLYNFKAATQLLKPSSVVNMLKQAMDNAELQASAGSAEKWVTEANIYEHLLLFIEKWYSDFTERVAYWYKKKTKQRLFLLGCVLGLFLNIDSIQLFSFYTENPAARDAVISYYQQNADTLNQLAKRMQLTSSTNTDSAVNAVTPYMSPETIATIDSELARLRKQDTIPVAPQVLNNAAAKAIADSIAAAKNGTNNTNNFVVPVDSTIDIPVHNPTTDTLHMLSKTFIKQLDSLRKTVNLPVGFEYSVFKRPVKWFYPLFLKLLGILISGLAASFGGPFWFDVLKKMCTRN
jgi:hypothetical protein